MLSTGAVDEQRSDIALTRITVRKAAQQPRSSFATQVFLFREEPWQDAGVQGWHCEQLTLLFWVAAFARSCQQLLLLHRLGSRAAAV
jgi:hypothetical protein